MVQILCAVVEPSKTDHYSLRRQAEVRDDLGLKVSWLSDVKWERKQLNSIHEDTKTDESYEQDFGVSTEKGSHTSHVALETKLEKKHVRTTTKNHEGNSKSVPALSLSLSLSLSHDIFSLSSYYGGLSFYTPFLSRDDFFKTVVANALLC